MPPNFEQSVLSGSRGGSVLVPTPPTPHSHTVQAGALPVLPPTGTPRAGQITVQSPAAAVLNAVVEQVLHLPCAMRVEYWQGQHALYFGLPYLSRLSGYGRCALIDRALPVLEADGYIRYTVTNNGKGVRVWLTARPIDLLCCA